MLIKGIEFTIFLEEILNYFFNNEIKIYYNDDIKNLKNYLQILDNKLYNYIVELENREKK
jgi:hypothetical protein